MATATETSATVASGSIFTEAQVLKLMQKVQGEMSQKEFAKRLKVSQAYLSDVYGGRRGPGPSMLKFLKLEKVYRRK